MNDSTRDTPEVIRCRSTADFLAALPQLVGFTAVNSIFVVFFSGSRAGRAMRIDLPASDDPGDSVGLIELICDAVRDLGATEGTPSAPAIVVSSEQTFAETGGPPWRGLAERLERRLRGVGLAPRELCCIAPDGWVSYLDPAPPRRGRPLGEIAESPIALEARLRGDTQPALSDLGAIPEPDPVRRAEVATALARIAPFGSAEGRLEGADGGDAVPRSGVDARDAIGGGCNDDAIGGADRQRPFPASVAFEWMADTADVVRALRNTEHPVDPPMTARLIRCAQHSDRWLLLALGILTRPDFAEELARELGSARFEGIPVGLEDDPPRSADTGWSIRGVLAGISPDFIEFERLPGLRRKLLTAVSESPEELRSGLLALSAWVWWLGGTQSVAQRQARHAAALDPACEIARMVERLVSFPRYVPRPRFENRAA
ncbi:DUF4192 family protein [Leucobacter triazinivorans]|uniref:DUF4192 family protein n=1 Tax=Leucobacter triazinivorans TaxID=1784719 RepID=A0A4V0Z1F3_9MICO|nr:DUF4192 family protein [Leucobacter triazinivorans]QBE48209.1 DUF4192 family protein [Leucobacter triazinivorans]